MRHGAHAPITRISVGPGYLFFFFKALFVGVVVVVVVVLFFWDGVG